MWYYKCSRAQKNFIPHTSLPLRFHFPFREISKKLESLLRATSSNVPPARKKKKKKPQQETNRLWNLFEAVNFVDGQRENPHDYRQPGERWPRYHTEKLAIPVRRDRKGNVGCCWTVM